MRKSIWRNCVKTIICLFVFSAATTLVHAETPNERKIRELTERVAKLEALVQRQLDIANGRTNNRQPSPTGVQPAAQSTVSEQANRQTEQRFTAVQPEEDGTDKTFNQLGQEAFIVRDQVPTLKSKKIEVSTQLVYNRNSGNLQSDRGITSINAIRYGVTDRFELGLVVPLYYTSRFTRVGVATSAGYEVKSVGDISITGSYLLVNQKLNTPGITFSAGVILPTGATPYRFGDEYAAGRNPIDIFSSYQSLGTWGAKADVQFFKTVDPVILFWGAGIEYLFSKKIGGYSVERGLQYKANAGISMALSEKSTVASSVNFSYSPDFRVDGTKVNESSSETFTISTRLIQRIGDSTYIEPSVAFGLTNNASDVTVGLGMRKRW